jgi:hypothetical protein
MAREAGRAGVAGVAATVYVRLRAIEASIGALVGDAGPGADMASLA